MKLAPLIKPVGNALYTNAGLAQFYDLSNETRPDFNYCRKLSRAAHTVLDLGCGTGKFAASISDQCDVTGVDPAAAMLSIARKRLGGENIRWVQGDARTIRLGNKFDLIILSGHVFQVFLTKSDQQALLKTISLHLKPEGCFVFDSRNPDFPQPKERSAGVSTNYLDHAELGKIRMQNSSSYNRETRILTYTNSYTVLTSKKEYSETAQILYTPKPELSAMLDAAGLYVHKWLGNWQGDPFETGSKEIMPFGSLA